MCAYMRVDKTSWKWATTPATRLNYRDMPTGNQFILVRDLGAGAHGHAWLACSDTGRVCVLKICRRQVAAAEFSWSSASAQKKDEEQLLRAELQAWNMVNKGACPAADLVFIAGKPALRMPYVVTVTRGDCDADVAEAVLRMAGIGVWHHDLHWRHVCKSPGSRCIVFIDFGDCDVGVPVSKRGAAARNMLANLGLAQRDGDIEAARTSSDAALYVQPYASGSKTLHPRRRASSVEPRGGAATVNILHSH